MTDDYFEMTTLRQFLDAGGELVWSPNSSVSVITAPDHGEAQC